VRYVMRENEKRKLENVNPQSELNQYYTDSESIVCCENLTKKKALDFQALSV